MKLLPLSDTPFHYKLIIFCWLKQALNSYIYITFLIITTVKQYFGYLIYFLFLNNHQYWIPFSWINILFTILKKRTMYYIMYIYISSFIQIMNHNNIIFLQHLHILNIILVTIISLIFTKIVFILNYLQILNYFLNNAML